jgi:mRNA-degrading endonuclease HigB of HigAB toxin-antitoxin module
VTGEQAAPSLPLLVTGRGRDWRATVEADRVVFNIKGNDDQLMAAVDFEKGIVWIKWIGAHKDYDKIDVKEVRHGD